MNILIFGGSFDPPHKGHAALLTAAARALRPDRILVVPSYQAPLKGRPGAGASDRLRMVRLGLLPALPRRWRARAAVDQGELRAGRRVYTVETLARLARRHPGAELHFVVGSDSAAAFGSWKEPARLKGLCRWWTAGRPGAAGRIPAFFGRIPGDMPEVSSTAVRARLAAGQDASAWVSKPVLRYIRSRGLYGSGLARALQSSLSPERFAHSLAVAAAAEKLALRWDEDPGRARLAGLLHDCGRSVPIPRMAAYARARRLKVPAREETGRRHPLLLHAYISEDLARRRYGVRDPRVLSAVRKHTLGARSMSALDRILYVADATSDDRAYPGVEVLRARAGRDLEAAFRGCVKNKLTHARASGAWLHPMTTTLWASLIK